MFHKDALCGLIDSRNTGCSYLIQAITLRCNIRAEFPVMLYKQDRRRILQQQLLNLHPRDNINEVERLIPDVQMHLLAEAGGDQHLLLQHAAEVDISFSNCSREKSLFRRMALNRLSSIPRSLA